MTQIEVKLNPDVTPTGSDLSIVNAARRSFGSRSEWASESKCPTDPVTGGKIPPYKRLKEKDQNLLRFLARGISTKDWDEFLSEVACSGFMINEGMENKESLVGALWKWRNTPTHETPFNHTFISFECKAPVFTARQLV